MPEQTRRWQPAWLGIAALSSILLAFTIAAVEGLQRAILGGAMLGFAFLSIAAHFRWLTRAALAAVAASVTVAADYPLTQEYVTGGARPGPDIWLSDLALLAALGVVFASILLRGGPGHAVFAPRGRLVLLSLLALLLWEVFSASGAMYGRYAAFQIVQDATALAIIVVLAISVRDHADVRFVILAMVFAIAFHIALAYAQILNGGPFGLSVLGEIRHEDLDFTMWKRYLGREFRVGGILLGNFFSGLAGAPYTLAALVVLLTPILGVMGVTEGKARWRWYLIGLSGVGIVLLSLSRGAWGALLIALLTTAWLFRRTGQVIGQQWTRSRIALLLVIMALPVIPLFGLLRSRLLGTNLEQTLIQRVELVQAGLGLLQDPVRGIGPNNFAVSFAGLEDLGLHSGTPIHTIYAVFLVETGLVGLALFLLVLFSLLRLGYWLVRNAEGVPAGWAAAIAGGMTGLIAWGATEWLYRSHVVYSTFWVLGGLLIALERFAVRGERSGSCDERLGVPN